MEINLSETSAKSLSYWIKHKFYSFIHTFIIFWSIVDTFIFLCVQFDALEHKQISVIPWYHLVQFSCSVMSDSLWPHGLQHARLPCPLPTPGAYSNSCPLSWWCHLTIFPSVVPFSSYLQSFPASGSFPVSQFFASGDQSIRISASASVPPMNIQDWFPLGLAGLISLNSKGLSGVFSSSTIQKHQFLCTQPSLGSSSYICTWISGKTPLF